MRRWQRYINTLKDLMGLRDWEVKISDDPCADGEVACVWVVPGQRRATVDLCRGFGALPPDEQRATLVHELLHLHASGMARALESLRPLVGLAAVPAADLHKEQEELMVEQIATAWSPHLPLPKAR